MFTKKQFIIIVALAIIAVVAIAVLELPTTVSTLMILLFVGLGAYFMYQNSKEKPTKGH